jgi:hypothetical protein
MGYWASPVRFAMSEQEARVIVWSALRRASRIEFGVGDGPSPAWAWALRLLMYPALLVIVGKESLLFRVGISVALLVGFVVMGRAVSSMRSTE